MSEIVEFAAQTPRHELPLLVAGQVQKEFFVNEALSRIDMLLAPTIETALTSPPPAPLPGECFLVAAPAAGDWIGQEDKLASLDGTQWTYVAPRQGTAVFDISSGQMQYFRNSWQLAPQPAAPSGGTVVDTEARAAIEQVIEVMRAAGMIAA